MESCILWRSVTENDDDIYTPFYALYLEYPPSRPSPRPGGDSRISSLWPRIRRARRAFIRFSFTRFRGLPRSRPTPLLACTFALARGGCYRILRGGLGNSARVTDAVHWVVTIWVLRLAPKAAKPATAPSTTRMAVRGFWCEAWNSAQFIYRTGHREPLLHER